jgi:ATP synthase I chain
VTDVYAASVHRMTRGIVAITVAGTVAAAILWKASGAAGFLLGAALSFLGFRRWRRVVESLAPGARRPARGWLLALVPLALALVLYVILKFSGINVMAVLAGLFVSLAAALIEALYQLYART